MHDSGGADTCGWEMLITSAVAIVFSCSDWDTYTLRVPSVTVPLDEPPGRWLEQKLLTAVPAVPFQRVALGNTAESGRKFQEFQCRRMAVGRLKTAPQFLREIISPASRIGCSYGEFRKTHSSTGISRPF